MEEWLPLYINPKGLNVAIFGGGSLGERRAQLFSEYGAKVRVYASSFTRDLKNMASLGRIELYRTDLSNDNSLILHAIEWADIVVVATGIEEIDNKIVNLAKSKRKLINDGVNTFRGNIIVPFRGKTSYGLCFSVTSLGRAGIAARNARDLIKSCLENGQLRTLYTVMARIKEYLKQEIRDPKKRIPLYFIIEKDHLFQQYIDSKNTDKAYERALEIINKYIQEESMRQ